MAASQLTVLCLNTEKKVIYGKTHLKDLKFVGFSI